MTALRLFVIWLLLAAAAAAAAPPSPRGDETDVRLLRELLAQAVKKGEARGVSLLVMHKGKVIFKGAAGDLGVDKPVAIASSTKPTTATALMALVDQGKVDLDAPITTYLPEFKGTKVEKAKVRQLLCHSAGVLGKYPDGRPKTGSLAEFSRAVAKKGALSAPGDFSYGGVGLDLCARICEVASGLPYEEHFKKAVLDPLGMKNTRFTMAAKVGDFGKGEGRYVSGGGGLSSTLDDLAAFYRMHLDGGVYGGKRVLSAKAVAQMHAKHATNPKRGDDGPFGVDYGLGFYLARPDKSGAHQTINHGGALGTLAWADKDRDLVGVVFVPGTLRAATPLITRVVDKVRELVPPAGKAVAAKEKPKADAPAEKPRAGKGGRLSIGDPEAAFKKLAGGNDHVTKEQFVKKMSEQASGFLKDRKGAWERIFDRLDADADGKLTLEEFKKIKDLRSLFGGKEKGG